MSFRGIHLKPLEARGIPAGPAVWSVIRLSGALGEYAAAWDRLNSRQQICHPMLDSRYVDSLLQHYGEGNEYLCLLSTSEELRGACILQPKGLGVWRSFLPAQTQVGPQLLDDYDALDGLYHALPTYAARIELLCVDPHVITCNIHPAGRVRALPQALTVSVPLEGTFEAYWATRSRNLVRSVRRYEKLSQSAGMQVRFTTEREPADVKAALLRYAELESRGWKSETGTAIAPGGEQHHFYEHLMSSFAADGRALVCEMWHDDRLVASRLLVHTATSLAILKTTYAEDIARFAPGRLLLKHVLEVAFTEFSGSTLEFCTDANADTLSWTSRQRHIEHVSHFQRRSIGIAFGLAKLATRVLPGFGTTAKDLTSTVTVVDSCAQLPEDAKSFLDEQVEYSLQLSAVWFQNLEKAVFQNDAGVRYFILKRLDVPIAVVPLLISTKRMGVRAESLGNYYTALYSPALKPWVKPRDLRPLVEAIRTHGGALASLTLSPMDPNSFAFKTMRAAFSTHGLVTFSFFCFGNWYLKSPPDWTGYLASRDGKVRSTLKRMTQRLIAEGGRLEVLSSPDDVERGHAIYKQVYDNSWKVPEPYPDFIPGLMHLCAKAGALRLGIAWVKDKPVAAQFWIVSNGRAEIYKLAYDEAYKALSPGTILTAHLMKLALENDKVVEVDYLIGDDAYKVQWMDRRRERWGLIAYDVRTVAGFGGCMTEAFGRLVKLFRRQWWPERAPIK